jgi:hypothetical protein
MNGAPQQRVGDLGATTGTLFVPDCTVPTARYASMVIGLICGPRR